VDVGAVVFNGLHQLNFLVQVGDLHGDDAAVAERNQRTLFDGERDIGFIFPHGADGLAADVFGVELGEVALEVALDQQLSAEGLRVDLEGQGGVGVDVLAEFGLEPRHGPEVGEEVFDLVGVDRA